MTKEKKNVIWNIIGATLNSFNSLFFAIIVTRINGLNDAGIFTYSFATACLLYNIGIYQGRVFQVTDISNKKSDMDYIYNKIFTCVFMVAIAVIFTIIKGYETYKILIFVLLNIFRAIDAFSEGIYAIIQKNGNLYQVGISLFIKSLLGLISFVTIDVITNNLILSCISLIVIDLLVLIFYDIKNAKKVGIEKTKFKLKMNNMIFKEGFFTFILTFLGIYLINAPRYAIDDILTDNLQTIFGIIIMPATVMGLLGQYIIQPALTKISKYIEERDYFQFKKIIINLITIIIFLGIVVLIVAYFLEQPILELIYGIELAEYFIPMMIIMIGAILYSLGIIISYILIAIRKTKIQAGIYLIVSVIATLLSYYLVNKIQILGASITYIVTMAIIAFSFAIYLLYNMRKYKIIWGKH